MPQNIKFAIVKQKNKKMQLFSDCRLWWSKEPQWTNDCGSSLPCFILVITRPQIPKNSVVKPKKRICNHLVTAYQAGQKNRS
jgi:hypothetical protein